MGDEQNKFQSASHTLLCSQRCNLGQISVSASDVTPIAQSLTSLNYFYLVCVFLCLLWGLVPKSFSIVGRCNHLLANHSSLLPPKSHALDSRRLEQLAEVV